MSPVFMLLLFALQPVAVMTANSGDILVRKKRMWIPPPKQLTENEDYTKDPYVAIIHSDFDDDTGNILYSLEGIGANQHPFHVFVVDAADGNIRVTKVLDREDIDTYVLAGVAKYRNGTRAEDDVEIRFKVIDENDNPPVFGVIQPGNVNELSPAGTSVMTITATDADEPGNKNSQIAYSIIEQNPDHDLFHITKDGNIIVKNAGLDRERTDQYTLTVRGQDLNGEPGGNSATGMVTINILDVNDNPPTLEKEELQPVAVMTANSGDILIHSDFDDDTGNILYSLEGVGANQHPFHVFVVDPTDGYIRVTRKLDREDIDTYVLAGVAKYRNGTRAEDDVDIRFKVIDENDNPPVFGVIQPGNVNELSPAGTSVMTITATDADEPGNKNSQIAYSIIEQNPDHDLFHITKDGNIIVKNSGLDRERTDQYTLTVRGQDLNGEPGGNSATGMVTINILDVNDNPPTLEKEEIHSDFDDDTGNILYSLEGIGANQHPFHVFVVDAADGYIRVTKKLDRENIDTYVLAGVAKYRNGTRAEDDVDIRFKVIDENDNPPVFGVIQPGNVNELSPAGTSVMTITATDADEPGNKNSQIAYSIIEQNPDHDLFHITKDGNIIVKNSGLDRERTDQYTLTVRGQDLNGEPGGNSATGMVTINILDVNDNPPTLEKEELQPVAVMTANSGDILVRKKRIWIPPPKQLTENEDYTKDPYVAIIHSDFDDDTGNILYSLEGVGANQHPFHVFVVDAADGNIRVTKVLDREDIDTYVLAGVAKYRNGTRAEDDVEIRFKVKDENDNPPVFGVIQPGNVNELSPAGTSVMTITATDADEPGNKNSQIAYSIIEQNPDHDLFHITKDGNIIVKNAGLDRERTDQYTLTVRGQDLNGEPGGNSATGMVTINILDVNDNPPTLEKEEYVGNIVENTDNVEVMRIKAEDLDVKDTENWEAVFDIVQGNEAGYFSIKTDPKTNEGILMLDKAVNYEDVKDLELGLVVRNKAPLHDGSGANGGAGIGFGDGTGGGGGDGAGGAGGAGGASGASGGATGASGAGAGGGTGGSSWQSGTRFKTYPIKINVKNQPEGPSFDPKVKAIPISEGGPIDTNEVIAHYPAIDEDTGKPAEKVSYAKGSDPDNLLTIDPETAEIKLNKRPDRESPYLVNGTYIAKVLCISDDTPDQTATGTIAIQVEDFNDNCPTLTSNVKTMCTTADAVIVNAKDEDMFPNGPPFHFAIIPEGTKGKWQVEHFNDTAAILRAQETVWPGSYEVELEVKDQQGEACPEPQKVTVEVCTCDDGVVCGTRSASKGAEFGPAGIGLLFLGLLLLALLLLFLLFCHCGGAAALAGGFTEMPFDTKSHLINYRTEGQGDNTEVPLLSMPMQRDGNMVSVGLGSANNTSAMAPMAAFDMQKSFTTMDGRNGANYQEGFASGREEAWGVMNQPSGSGFYSEFGSRESGVGGGMFDSIALPDHVLRQCYNEKMTSLNENLAAIDGPLAHFYEGNGSLAGSVGCCSLLESDNDLQFLEDLGPKFKTLAEVCGGKKIQTEVEEVYIPRPSAHSINIQTSVSNAQQLAPPPKLQPSVPKPEQTLVREKSEHSQVVKESIATAREGMTTVKEGMANQGQMVLLQPQQQPVYYTTAPLMQPMHYVVQPQVQNTMLLAAAPATNMQSMVLLNGGQTGPGQGMVFQEPAVMSSGQAQRSSMVLVERSGVQAAAQPLWSNVIHTGNLSGPQTMMVVEGKVPAGSVKGLKGSQTCLVQGGTLQPGGPSGSQRILVVGGPKGSMGQRVQGTAGLAQKCDISGSQRDLYSTSTGSHSSMSGSSTTTVSTTPTSHKVVVQEKITEL
ncbi:desmoglein-2.1-like [Centropristis striata]|uniref:desmoglein-2.1-like n=1 Tax=Centropristis striata TaxID=184440 RepID=UPI0027DFDF08|nr:desmoglein-2.1-like [Centropristis striata]